MVQGVVNHLDQRARATPLVDGILIPMIFAAELIQELQKEFPHLRIPAITDTDDLAGLLLFITEVPNTKLCAG
jgi:hypothetical protein